METKTTVDVSGGESKVQCCKEQYCIGTWNFMSMNEDKLEVVKQRMGKTRVLLKKIGDTKGSFHVKMGTIKDRNSKDLAEEDY